MRTWARVPVETPCGRCGTRIASGEPMQVIQIAGVKELRYRCQTCEGPAPELQALKDKYVAVTATVKPKKPWTRMGEIDWKAKASQ